MVPLSIFASHLCCLKFLRKMAIFSLRENQYANWMLAEESQSFGPTYRQCRWRRRRPASCRPSRHRRMEKRRLMLLSRHGREGWWYEAHRDIRFSPTSYWLQKSPSPAYSSRTSRRRCRHRGGHESGEERSRSSYVRSPLVVRFLFWIGLDGSLGRGTVSPPCLDRSLCDSVGFTYMHASGVFLCGLHFWENTIYLTYRMFWFKLGVWRRVFNREGCTAISLLAWWNN